MDADWMDNGLACPHALSDNDKIQTTMGGTTRYTSPTQILAWLVSKGLAANGHTHSIADITGLATQLSDLVNSIATKADSSALARKGRQFYRDSIDRNGRYEGRYV